MLSPERTGKEESHSPKDPCHAKKQSTISTNLSFSEQEDSSDSNNNKPLGHSVVQDILQNLDSDFAVEKVVLATEKTRYGNIYQITICEKYPFGIGIYPMKLVVQLTMLTIV